MDERKAPKVSVIMPIYNVEDYLAECLDSVLAQTLTDLEIICVNDGSTDSSPDILGEYAARDARIVRIDKENGGYGKAVNRGLDEARGEWIAIVEPDDIIDPHMYEDLTELGQPDKNGTPADIVKGSYWLYFHFDGEAPYVNRPNLMNCMPQGVCEPKLDDSAEIMKHHPSIWSAIYRSDFIREQGIRMIEPKGAGWADNPWFFETMLTAKRIVWTPAPYYYYRQTNPNASSKLKDFHMPFDRLRDIRGIYDRLGITNEKLLIALYQRSFDYICTTLLEEFNFPENDPEMIALIREVFETFDEDLVLDEDNDILERRKNYYRDIMGLHLKKLARHEACEHPRISFIVPMHNDRRGLWDTMRTLTDQTYRNIEIICVDCSSPDRSLEIATDISRIDKRVTALSGATCIAEGCGMGLAHAKGDYVHFVRPGIMFNRWSTVRDIVEGMGKLGEDVDIVVFRKKFEPSRLIPKRQRIDAVPMITEGIESDVNLVTLPAMHTRLYRRAMLESAHIDWDDPVDEFGLGLCVQASAAAQTAGFVFGHQMREEMRQIIDRESIADEDGLIRQITAKYEAAAHAAEKTGTDLAWRLARGTIVYHMAFDIARIGQHRSGQRYFEELRRIFETEYGISSAPRSEYANYLDYGVLEEAFSLNYEDYAKYLMTRHQKDLINLTMNRDKLERKLDRIKQSGSYVLGKKMATFMKDAIPRSIRREFIYRNTKEENSKDD